MDSNRTAGTAVLAMALAFTWAGALEAAAQAPAGPRKPAAKATPPPAGAPTRTEKDLLGEKQIPGNAYYGVQTARALENFPISGIAINHYPGFVEAWAIVKLAAARANTDVGAMKPETLALIRDKRGRD
jgi:hypothetical protein